MKNKETIIGWVLIALLMIGFIFYQQKKVKEEQLLQKTKSQTTATDSLQKKVTPDSSVTATPDTTPTAAAPIPQPDSLTTLPSTAKNEYGPFADAAKGQEDTFVIENDLQKITLSTKGGRIKSVELKKYKTWDKKPLILFNDTANMLSYQFAIGNDRVIDTKDFYFTPESKGFAISGNDSASFIMRLPAGEGRYFEQKYTLHGNSYMFGYSVSLVGLNDILPSNSTFIGVTWKNTLTKLEHDLQLERRYSALYYRFNKSDVDHLDESKENVEYVFDAPLEWISFKQQFFNSTLLSDGQFSRGKLKSHYAADAKDYVKKYDATFTIPYKSTAHATYNFQYYLGPNGYNTLASYHRDLQSIIKLSPDFWLFSWMKYITRFIIFIFDLFSKLNLNYGIIILLMTLILKIVLHPLTAKSIESAAKMKILAPELAALKEKYGQDQSRMSQEQMKLYQRAGVNPLGGCLPMLLQMPILLSMYYFFPASIELRQKAFLWAPDLSSYDAVFTWATPILGQTHLSLFTLLMTASSVLQAVMNNQMNQMGNQQPGMKYIPYFMPVMLMFIFNSFPAALTYYYLLQNLLGVGHQWVIQKFVISDEKLRKQIEENKKNPKKKSGFMKRFEEIQRQASAAQKAKQQKR